MYESTTSLDDRRRHDEAREAAESLWRILRYASCDRRPRGWGGFEAEARHYVELLGIMVNEYSRLAAISGPSNA